MRGQQLPRLTSLARRSVDRVDPRERYAAQDERGDRSGKVQTLREAAVGYDSPVLDLAEHVLQRVAADGVDTPGPPLPGEGGCGRLRQLRPGNDQRGAQPAQILLLRRPAGGGVHL